jgi:hypothetical protein
MQSSNHILLIKPAGFSYNKETAASNAFQTSLAKNKQMIDKLIIQEFDRMVQSLVNKGMNVTVIDDTITPIKPDAIFPNNWVTFHADGTVVLYPMLALNRRLERRMDVLKKLEETFVIKELIDLSIYEKEGLFLEGTGSIIFDHIHKMAYACTSPRTDKQLFIETCSKIGYKPVHFSSVDAQGKEIYHTNVMMSIGNGFSVVCLDSITNQTEKEFLIESLTSTGHQIIDISQEQTNSFCGNMLELELPGKKNILAMSKSAFQSLSDAEKNVLNDFCELLPFDIDTIEQIGGGSVRCMIAEIFLPLRN